jgi:hypothetical protein
METSIARKRRKQALGSKRNKRQSVLNEMKMRNNKKSIASHKRCLILKQKRVAKRAGTENSGQSAVVEDEIWNFGKTTFKCQHCNTLLWYEECLSPNRHTSNPSFGISCQNGKISLPVIAEPPAFLLELLNGGDQV